MLLRTVAAALLRVLALLLVPGAVVAADGGDVRVVFAFAKNPGADCEIQMTPDSVRFLIAPLAAERKYLGARVLTPAERDSAQILMSLASRWTGYRRYACRDRGAGAAGSGSEGYTFSLWSDSLLLACDNCFSCNDGMSLSDARVMARFGKMTLWLYRMREEWPP